MTLVTYTVRGAGDLPRPVVQWDGALPVGDGTPVGGEMEWTLRSYSIVAPATHVWERAGWRVTACDIRPWRISSGKENAVVLPFPPGGRR